MVEIGERMKAQERLEAISDRAVAAGAMKKAKQRRHLRALERAARQRRRARPGTASDLRSMGFSVVIGGDGE